MKRRRRIHVVPAADDALIRLLSVKPGEHRGLGVEMEVLPYKNRWEWRVWLLFNGRSSISGYSEGWTWHHPGANEVRGRCRDEDEAWRRARECAEDVRLRYAASQNVEMRRRRQAVRL
jgi:hypothetical protein